MAIEDKVSSYIHVFYWPTQNQAACLDGIPIPIWSAVFGAPAGGLGRQSQPLSPLFKSGHRPARSRNRRLIAQNGTPNTHLIQGDKLRALRRLWRKSPPSPFVFVSERGSPLPRSPG
jgi:hypothetical protein